MALYLKKALNPASWPEPIETVYQALCGGGGSSLTPKLPHLREWDALFLAGVVRMPRESRPHGIISWASDAFQLSRTSIYALGERIEAKLFGQSAPQPAPQRAQGAEVSVRSAVSGKSGKVIEVTPVRVKRTILRATFPGNVSIRPTQEVVYEALAERPSVGYISELRVAAGLRARRLLRSLDYSGIGQVIVGRDETFFGGQPVLMVIEPVSMTILLAEVCADHQADTWGAALLVAQAQGATIRGLIEDMARNDEKSQALADLANIAVQKDSWHLTCDSAQLRHKLEKAAYQAMQQVLALEKRLNQAWSAKDFDGYLNALASEAKAIEQYDAYRSRHAHFCDALEIVDWRSGEIRDCATAAWFLNAVLEAMALCTDTRILAFLKTLRRHQPQLLTFLTWLHQELPAWRTTLQHQLHDPLQAHTFERLVAQHGYLQQKLIAGQTHWQAHAAAVALRLDAWLAENHTLPTLAARLMRIFDQAGHTNSITEALNGLLKSFLNARQCFHSTETMQAYLDLFVLWHNTRIFDRGKRSGHSPFQLAGVKTPSGDWITLLGY